MIIDAHVHLWEKQQGIVDGKPVISLSGGRSNFGGEIRQMMPPYMIDGKNTVPMLMSNMDYAGVSACVVTQEYIDGNQDRYLLACKKTYGHRMKVCCLYKENEIPTDWLMHFDGVKICGGRLTYKSLLNHIEVFQRAELFNKFISIDLAEGVQQVDELQIIAEMFPKLRIAIGHFGMVTVPGWERQIALANNPNVYIESGGITWLFHKEYYPYPSAIEAIREAIGICGIDKLMWGSDYPRTMTAITYKMSMDFIQKTERLTEIEKSMLLGNNARKFYGFADIEEPKSILNMVE